MPELLYSMGYDNHKIGIGVPVVTSPRVTCPDVCPLKNGGCYGENFGPLNWHWNKLSKGLRGVTFDQLIRRIEEIPRDAIWRMNQVGDIVGTNNTISARQFKKIIAANRKKKGFTFTHKPVLGRSAIAKKNRELIAYANSQGFTVNLSADNISDADKKKALGIGPVAVTVQSFDDLPRKTPAGNQLTPCPNETSDGKITCASCRLCTLSFRQTIIAFKNISRRVGYKNDLRYQEAA